MTTEQVWLGHRSARAGASSPRASSSSGSPPSAAGRAWCPVAFWYFSIGGGLTLLAYAIYRHDPVFILGQAAGLFVYARNLYFIRRAPRQPVARLTREC